jgi:large subunit ribosomal protein L6
VKIPAGCEVSIGKESIEVKGPKGQLSTPLHPRLDYVQEGDAIVLTRKDESRDAREQHGLRRTLLDNVVVGVSQGFKKDLEVVGVGYRVQVQGNKVVLTVGYSHPVEFDLPKGVEAQVEGNKLSISGIDKQVVGEVAAKIRRVRKPEPYKGKGIKYLGEQVRRKSGKSGGK